MPDILPPEWINLTQSHLSPDKVVLAKFNLHALLGAPAFIITIDEQLTWTMACFGNPVEKQECRLLKSTPNKLTNLQDVITLLHIISDSRLCQGNAAADYQDAVSIKFPSLPFIGRIVAYQESLSLMHPTVRSSSCEFILSSEMSSKKERCQACSSFRHNLRVQQNRATARSSESRCAFSSCTLYSCLSQDEMKTRMANLQKRAVQDKEAKE